MKELHGKYLKYHPNNLKWIDGNYKKKKTRVQYYHLNGVKYKDENLIMEKKMVNGKHFHKMEKIRRV